MAITSAFQADDAGSIPAARSKQQRSRSMSGFFVSGLIRTLFFFIAINNKLTLRII
jgi:hypothetical protein